MRLRKSNVHTNNKHICLYFVMFTGLSLTVADAGNTNITVSGPSQLKALLDSTRHFMKLPDGLLRLVQHDSCDQTSSSGPHVVFQNSEVLLQQITFKAPTDSLESTSTELTSRCCYIGNTPELQGKFDIKRAEAFNVPKGPLFGKLKKGETITLADGTVIKPEQVLGESEPSRYFAVVCRIAPEETALLHEVTNNCHLNRFVKCCAILPLRKNKIK